MEYKIFKQKDEKNYENKIRYLNGNDQDINRRNHFHFGSLGQSLKYKFTKIPQKIMTSKHVYKRDKTTIESNYFEHSNGAPSMEDGKYDIDSEYVFNPEYTIEPQDTDKPKGITVDKFTTKQIDVLAQNSVNLLNEYQIQDTPVIDDTSKKTYNMDLLNFASDRQVTYEITPDYKRQETNYDRKLESILINKTTRPAKTITSKTIVLKNKAAKIPSVVRKPCIVLSDTNVAQESTTKTVSLKLSEYNDIRTNSSGILSHFNK